jgi:hypothetical protein
VRGEGATSSTKLQKFGEQFMGMSRNTPTDVMLRHLILTLDRQQQQMTALTEAIHRMASSNEEVVAILGETLQETLQDNLQDEPEKATNLAQVMDKFERGFT